MKKQKELPLKFTGKMTVLVDVEEFDPMQFTVDDIDIVMEVVHVIIGKKGTMEVSSYGKKEGKKFKSMVEMK